MYRSILPFERFDSLGTRVKGEVVSYMAIQFDEYDLHTLYRDLQMALNKHEPERLTPEDATEIKRLCLHLAAELVDRASPDEGKD
jgi:hypothetical protein